MMNQETGLSGWLLGAICIVCSLVGCSSTEKRVCELQLGDTELSNRDEVIEECVAQVKQHLEKCENAREVRSCYSDADSTSKVEKCYAKCTWTDAARAERAGANECSEAAQRCRELCDYDHDCLRGCNDVQTSCLDAL